MPVDRLPASHPVRAAVADWLARWGPNGRVTAGRVAVAASGGADSLALAAAVIAEIGDRDPLAVTVDHRLQAGSAAQAARCVDQLRDLGYRDVRCERVEVPQGPGSGGPEAAARSARYAVLSRISDDAGAAGRPCRVLLGHTLDDQAETVLLGLARGSGPRSVAGMRAWRPPWGRPLLGVRRSDTVGACRLLGLTPWADPHNADPAFTRARLRAEVLPLLEEVLGGGVAAALARTATLLDDDLLALDRIADGVLHRAADDTGLRIDTLADWPAAVRRRVLRRWLADGGIGGLTADHLYRLDALTGRRDGAAVRLPGGVDVVREAGTLTCRSTSTDRPR